jgi:drug/metabolite transporter (DMT)-like permease
MRRRAAYSFRTRSAVTALVALVLWAIFSAVPSLGDTRPDVTLFGLPLRVALALPVVLPLIVLTTFWFVARQNRDDERFRDDD